METSLDRILAIAGLAVGLAGIYASYYFYLQTLRTKLIAYSTKLVVELDAPFEGCSFSYLGKNLGAVSRVLVLLWNRGSDAIQKSYFLHPICIEKRHDIVKLAIVHKDAAADITIDEKENSISVSLLRPNEAVLLSIDASVSNFQPDLTFQMMAADMSAPISLDSASGYVEVGSMIVGMFLMLVLSVGLIWLSPTSPDVTITLMLAIFGATIFGVLQSRSLLSKLSRRRWPSPVLTFRNAKTISTNPMRHFPGAP